MSSSYYIYTEMKINDKWVAINGLIPHFDWHSDEHKYSEEYKYTLSETYQNGSRSYFGRTYEKLQEIGNSGKFTDMSQELQKVYSEAVEDEKNGVEHWYYPIYIDFNIFRAYTKTNSYDRHGIIHKDDMFAWDSGDAEDLYPLPHRKYAELSDEEKKQYAYYEWDDPWEWHGHFKEIMKNAMRDINAFKDMNYMCDDNDTRLVLIGGQYFGI